MKRIQRQRTKGWKMPENALYVGRPTRYGNPYTMAEYGRVEALKLYREWLKQKLLQDPLFLEPLRGKDLACWCRPLQDSCHADIILEMLK